MTNPLAQIRLENLRFLAEKCHSVAELNARLNRPRAHQYLYQLLRGAKNATGAPRAPGPAICEALEKAFDLPGGWMNAPHGSALEIDAAAAERRQIKEKFSITEPQKAEKAAPAPLLSSPGRSFLLDPLLLEGLDIQHPAVFRVVDETMEPRFLPGDILIIDLDKTAIQPGFFIIESTGNAILRKIGVDILGRKIFMADGLPGMIAPIESARIIGAVARTFRPVRP